jgi:hypothetical protein
MRPERGRVQPAPRRAVSHAGRQQERHPEPDVLQCSRVQPGMHETIGF